MAKEKKYYFKVTYRDTRSNAVSATRIVARNILEAKNKFKAENASLTYRKLVACVRENECISQDSSIGKGILGTALFGLVSAASIAFAKSIFEDSDKK